MIDYGKRDVLGVHIDAVDLECALDRISFFIRERRPLSVSALAAHGTIEATRDARLRDALNDFDLVLPDGQSVRWALNLLYGLDLPDKVPGPTVVDHLLDFCAQGGSSVYFYGSTDETLALIRTALARRFGAGLTVAGTPSRFAAVDRAELTGITDAINASGASLCLVGLGCPRQERFVAATAPALQMPALAVGAAFDYIAGNIDRAPEVMQRAGLEWLYRTAQEPRRLAGRYITTNAAFASGVARQALRARLRRGAAPTPPPTGAPDRFESIDA